MRSAEPRGARTLRATTGRRLRSAGRPPTCSLAPPLPPRSAERSSRRGHRAARVQRPPGSPQGAREARPGPRGCPPGSGQRAVRATGTSDGRLRPVTGGARRAAAGWVRLPGRPSPGTLRPARHRPAGAGDPRYNKALLSMKKSDITLRFKSRSSLK
nr:translation initiation factor IF-2-like isoform X2 [Manis javanica]